MKKIILLSICTLLTISICTAQGCFFKKKTKNVKITEVRQASEQQKQTVILPTMNTDSNAQNRIWVGTFQIVWNDMIDNFVHKPVEFVEGENLTAQNLNRREFNKEDISEDSYYTKFGIVSPQLKNEIETGIKKKFNETSDILKLIDFTYNPNKHLFYAMLKKDFKYLEPFDKLKDAQFGSNPKLVKYFGIDSDSHYKLYKNLEPLFYNNNKDFAVKIFTQGSDEIILYRTDEEKRFDEYLNDINLKSENFNGNKHFGRNDRLKIPNIEFFRMTGFKDLEQKTIKGTNIRIDKTIETVDFKMDNEGVKLKSEAAIMVATTALPTRPPMIRYFYFDDAYVIFLQEKGKNVPYFAIRVGDIESLNSAKKE